MISLNFREIFRSGAFLEYPQQVRANHRHELSESTRPTDAEVEAAARVLDKAGRHHHWWPKTTKPYDEFAKTDPIAKSEFEGIVEQLLMAASAAKRNTETP